MNFITAHLLSLILFVPALAAVIMLFLPNGENKLFRWFASGASLIPLVLSLIVWFNFRCNAARISNSKNPTSGTKRSVHPSIWVWMVSRSLWFADHLAYAAGPACFIQHQ